MKYETTEPFDGDWGRLSKAERALFRATLMKFVPAAEAFVSSRARWPASLRVRSVSDTPGVFEMTWSFSGPDGRATFEWIEIDGELAVLWRRIGDHAVFRAP